MMNSTDGDSAAIRAEQERIAYAERNAELAELWNGLTRHAVCVVLKHPSGRVVVEQRGGPESIGDVLERVVRALARS